VKSRSSYPLRIEKNGVTVLIYRHRPKSGYVSYVVTHHIGGRRHRTTFSDLNRAKKEAKATAKKLAAGEAAALQLRNRDGIIYVRALERLKPLGIELDKAAADYAEAVRALNGKGTLIEAVNYFLRSRPVIVNKSIKDVLKEMLVTKQAQGLSERTLDDLRKRLGRFAKSCRVPIHEITAARIQDFLVNLKVSGRTQNNFRMTISNMFNFARLRGYVGKDQNPAAEVPQAKEVQGDVGIFTPDEMTTLLEHGLDKFKPFLAIAAFAGLRTAEVERLDWSDVGTQYIKVRGSNSKTGAHRLVEIQPNLQAWLTQLRKPSGPVVLVANVTNAQVRLIRKAKIKWKHNALRHSYGSYRLALLKDPAKVAYEMGNSPRMVFAHYRELVTSEEANRWFNVLPPGQPA